MVCIQIKLGLSYSSAVYDDGCGALSTPMLASFEFGSIWRNEGRQVNFSLKNLSIETITRK